MSKIPTLPGITSTMVATSRLQMHVLSSGPADGEAVLFIHGNASSATFWEETMLALPAQFRAIAPDLRGYGETEDLLIDATRGCGDWVDDLIALLDTLGIDRCHAVGHSLGGVVLFNLIAAVPQRIITATLVAPGSPYGFGGCKGLNGELCWPDGAGSGGGTVNQAFVERMAAGDTTEEAGNAAPRVVMNTFYWKPPFRPTREEALLASMLSEKVGPQRYPGDFKPSPHWPGVAPGVWGPINAISPLYVGDAVERFVAAEPKPPILWVRGADDQIVSDMSLFDVGTLGQLGILPDWPGADAHPPQPMIGQTRAVLERYAAAGGRFHELIFAECGHTPYIEHPDQFNAAFHDHLRNR
ncbi:alpha/beta hydrolase [Chloroflexus sp.]|uniref:alpha/beta hydrolase n=1 Tax=Chloroflexus sp. TaxID=1904827 RepID=UPI002ADE42A9|nr:alpha/beta fold hydrolase [Chloroflexus sp.]